MFAHSECCEAGLIPRIMFYRCFVYAKEGSERSSVSSGQGMH